ncbi:MAG: hypothetical protein Q4D38_08020 [Planctomycetia bacterium]|nr:hypothetical protein [Planctomycetia bacterium]
MLCGFYEHDYRFDDRFQTLLPKTFDRLTPFATVDPDVGTDVGTDFEKICGGLV